MPLPRLAKETIPGTTTGGRRQLSLPDAGTWDEASRKWARGETGTFHPPHALPSLRFPLQLESHEHHTASPQWLLSAVWPARRLVWPVAPCCASLQHMESLNYKTEADGIPSGREWAPRRRNWGGGGLQSKSHHPSLLEETEGQQT